MMNEAIAAIQADSAATAVTDPDLMDEIRYITEYPYGLKGTFENEYLDLPKAVLVNVMEGHQRYIPLGEAGRHRSFRRSSSSPTPSLSHRQRSSGATKRC